MRPVWLPDWHKADQYPDPKAKRLVWAWQFQRRDPEYQKLWAQLIQPHYNPAHVEFSLQNGSRRARRVSDRVAPRLHEHTGDYDLEPFRERFGIITVPPDPAEPEARLRFAAQFIRFARKPLNRPGKPGWKYTIDTVLQDDEVLVWFDLRWPIPSQLKAAKQLLKEQAADADSRFRSRVRAEQYTDYLRLLDAKLAGATDAEVAKVLYQHLSDKHPDFSGSHQVRADRKIAEDLRDHAWRIVARGSGGE